MKTLWTTILMITITVSAKAEVNIENMHRFFTSVTLLNEGIDIRFNGAKSNNRKAARELARNLASCDSDVETGEEFEVYTLKGQTCSLDHKATVTRLPADAESIVFSVDKSTGVLDPDVTFGNVVESLNESSSYRVQPAADGSNRADFISVETSAKAQTSAFGEVTFDSQYEADNRIPGREKIKQTVVVVGDTFTTTAEYKALGQRETCKLDGKVVDCFELAYALGAVEPAFLK